MMDMHEFSRLAIETVFDRVIDALQISTDADGAHSINESVAKLVMVLSILLGSAPSEADLNQKLDEIDRNLRRLARKFYDDVDKVVECADGMKQ